MRPRLALAACMVLSTLLGGCGPYRLIRPDEIPVPSYDPRPVAVPERCEALIRRAADEGAARLSEAEARDLAFCQQQHLIRAQEEEAAAKKIEAHAEAANFALRLTAYTLGALIAVLTWVF